jgi:hypothetical protein
MNDRADNILRSSRKGRDAATMADLTPRQQLIVEIVNRCDRDGVRLGNVVEMIDELLELLGSYEAALAAIRSGAVTVDTE